MVAPLSELISQMTTGALSDDMLLDAARRIAEQDEAANAITRAWDHENLPIIGPYYCIKRLGHGAAGVVYKAVRFSPEPQLMALKLLRFSAEEERQRFLEREIEILRALDCPYVSRYLDSGIVGGMHYLAMELVQGIPLDDFLAEHTTAIADRLATFQRVCEVVAEVHARGVIHRDLKPKHILVDEEGQPRIVDFGLSAVRSEEWPTEIRRTQTQLGHIIGTLKYMSPEQAWGGLIRTDHRVDVWALGVMLYEIATDGQYPYELSPQEGLSAADALLQRIQNEMPRRPRIPSTEFSGALFTLICRCLEPDRRHRLGSVDQLAADIGRCRARAAIMTRPLPFMHRFSRLATGLAIRWRPALWWATVPLVVLVVVLVAKLSGVRWRVSGQDYSVETRKRLIMAAETIGPPEFLIVGVSDDSLKHVPRIAASNGLTGSNGLPEVTGDLLTWRAVHGQFMERLAKARPRVVVWDYFFRTPQPGDDCFVRGVRSLEAAGVPVVLAATRYDAEGHPELSPRIMDPLRGRVHHGLIMARDMVRRPGEFVMALRRGEQTLPSMALAAFGAICYPECQCETTWPSRNDDVMLRYVRRGTSEYLREIDEIKPSVVTAQLAADADAQQGDMLALKTFELTPPSFWRERTLPYEQVLVAADEELADRCGQRIVVVADVRRPHLWQQYDVHPASYDGEIKNVHGGYLLADAIRGYLSNESLETALFPAAGSFILVAGVALIGCLIAVPLAARKLARRRLVPTIMLVCVGVAGVAWLRTMSQARTDDLVELSMTGAAFCLAATVSLAIEFTRNRHRSVGGPPTDAAPGSDSAR